MCDNMSKLIEALPKKIGGFAAVNETISFWDNMHHYRKYNRILLEYINLKRSGYGWNLFMIRGYSDYSAQIKKETNE